MSKSRKTPSQLGRSLSQIRNALDEWEELQKNSENTKGHPADIQKKTRELLKDLKNQINDLKL